MRLCWEVWIQVLFCEGVDWEETVPVLTQDWVLHPWARSPAGLRSVGTKWEMGVSVLSGEHRGSRHRSPRGVRAGQSLSDRMRGQGPGYGGLITACCCCCFCNCS